MLLRIEEIHNAAIYASLDRSTQVVQFDLLLFKQTQPCTNDLTGIFVASMRDALLDESVEMTTQRH